MGTRLIDRVAIVTGAANGIGRSIAVELAAHGYNLVITYKANEAAAAETLRLVREAGGEGEVLKFDVGDAAEYVRRPMSPALK